MRLTRFTRFAIARFAPTATPRAEDNRVCGVSLYTDGGNTICEASRAYGSATVSHSCPFLFLVSVAVRSMENALLPPPSLNGPAVTGDATSVEESLSFVCMFRKRPHASLEARDGGRTTMTTSCCCCCCCLRSHVSRRRRRSHAAG